MAWRPSPSALSIYERQSAPASVRGTAACNAPWATGDVSVVGQHGYNIVEGLALNTVDLGTAFLPQYQDLTKAPSTPGATSVDNNVMRPFRGYAGISQNTGSGWNTSHLLRCHSTAGSRTANRSVQ